jgi:hypothetical protein
MLVAAAGIAVGTGAFTATEVDRSVGVAVADDENAMLGLTLDDQVLDYGPTRGIDLVTVTNRFDEPVTDVTVEVVGDRRGPPPALRRASVPDADLPLHSGESAHVTGTIVCAGSQNNSHQADGTVTVSISATTGSTTVETTRDVPVTCVNRAEESANRSERGPSASDRGGNSSKQGGPPGE